MRMNLPMRMNLAVTVTAATAALLVAGCEAGGSETVAAPLASPANAPTPDANAPAEGAASAPAGAAEAPAQDGARSWAGTQVLGTVQQEDARLVRRTRDGGILVAGNGLGEFDPVQDALPKDRTLHGFLAWFAPDGALERVQTFLPADQIMAMDVDATGAILIAGFNGLGGGTWLSKLDAAGAPLWRVDLAFGIIPAALAAAPDGGVVVGGETHSPDPFRPDLSGPWVARFDRDGNPRWQTQLATDPSGFASAIALGAGGDVHVVGRANGLFAARLSRAGGLRWSVPLGVETFAAPSAIAVDARGNGYVAGSAGAGIPGIAPAGFLDAYLVAIGPDGAIRWYRAVATAGLDTGRGVAARPGGGVVLAGGADGFPAGFAFAPDSFLARFDDDGTLAWIADLGRPDEDFASDVTLDGAGNAVVAGSVHRSGGNVFDRDVYVAKVSAAGQVL